MKLVPKNLFERNRLFEDFWSPVTWGEDYMEEFFAPKVDVKDCKDHYEINAELPGVKKDDIKVSLVDGVLILEAEVEKEDKEEKDGRYIRQERHYGKMMRRFNLGEDVREEDIEAKFKDGVLKLRAPKLEVKTAAKERRIAVH